jgi:hypothetical protein
LGCRGDNKIEHADIYKGLMHNHYSTNGADSCLPMSFFNSIELSCVNITSCDIFLCGRRIFWLGEQHLVRFSRTEDSKHEVKLS